MFGAGCGALRKPSRSALSSCAVVAGTGRRCEPTVSPSRSRRTSSPLPNPMNEYRARRSPPSTLSSRKRGSKSASFMNADTGVSRSPEISNGGFKQLLPGPNRAHDKKPITGAAGDGFGALETLKVEKLSSDRAHSVRECATTRGEAGCDAAATFAAEYGGAPPWPSRTPPPLRASRSRRRCYNSRKPRRSDCPLELQRAAGKLVRDGGRAADSDSIRSPTAHRRRRAAERARRNVPRPHGRAAHHRSAGHRPGG